MSNSWERIQTLFHAVADLPPADRQAYLDAHAADDPELAAAVLAMVAEDAAGGSVLDDGIAPIAERVLSVVPPGLVEQKFGPYRLERVLGEGGMGVVYLARRADLDSVAALKILRDASLSPSRRDRFAAEQRTLAQLSHPTIAQFYDADTLPDGTPWLAMEYVEGVPITEYCRNRNTTLRGRLTLLRTVAEAVQYAHRQAVIHRDIKPSNLLVRADGTVKLLDFGIAKQLESLDQAEDQTRTGLLLTPAYAAPEQLLGGRVGTYTDVFALGMVMFELLSGRRPRERSGETAEPPVADAARERPSAAAKDPEAPSFGRTLARSEWADLDVLYATCTSPEPERRYRTVDALIRDIDHFLGGEPLEARPDTMGYRLKKFVRRNRRAVTAALASVAFVTLLIAFYTWRLANARTEAVAEAARTRRVERFMMDLFQGGDTEASPADSLRVLTLVDRGLAEARALDQEPAIQADMFETLGNVYRGLGRLERADTLLLGALRLRRNLLPDDDPDVGRSQIALGNLRADQAAYEEAERMIREGLATVSHRGRPDHADVIFGMTSLARVFELQGRYGEAIAMLEDVARRLEGNEGARAELAQALYGLANNHFYAGHYQTADSLNRIVLPMSRAIYGDRHPNVASDLINLGAVQQELGNYQEAERFQREALEIVRAWYGPDHPETAASLTMVGRALWYQGRSDEAVGMLREALAVQERVYGPVHPRIASTLNEIAGIAYQRDRYDEAEAAYRRIIDIYRAVYPGGHYYIGIALANLAGVYQGRRQHRQAEALYREALGIYEKTLDAGNVNIGIGHIKLGRSLLRQGRFGEAVTETRKGYEMLIAQANPAVSFLRAARLDLVAGYDSLGRTADADRFRRELADSATAKAP